MQASPTLSCPPDFTRRLGVILACLVALIAQRFLRDPFHVALNVPLGTFIKLAAQRLDCAFARFAAGILPRPRAARSCGFQRKAARYSNLIAATVPI
jgi:hypothetical protein